MKKLVVLMILSSLLPFCIFAKEEGDIFIGFSSDYAYNIMHSNTGYRDNTTYQAGKGFAVSIPLVYQVNEWFSVESGLKYIQKNYGWEHRKFLQEDYSYTDYVNYTNTFLELPVALNFSLGTKYIRNVSSIGGYLGFWIDSDQQGALTAWDSSLVSGADSLQRTFDNDRAFTQSDNRFEAGLLFRTGFEFEIERLLLFVRGSYYLGLTDLQKNYQKFQVRQFNHTMTAEIGMLFNFNGGK